MNYLSITDRKYIVSDDPLYYVEWWWDRYTHNWIIQLKDKDGYQIGSANYAPNIHVLNIEVEDIVNRANEMLAEGEIA